MSSATSATRLSPSAARRRNRQHEGLIIWNRDSCFLQYAGLIKTQLSWRCPFEKCGSDLHQRLLRSLSRKGRSPVLYPSTVAVFIFDQSSFPQFLKPTPCMRCKEIGFPARLAHRTGAEADPDRRFRPSATQILRQADLEEIDRPRPDQIRARPAPTDARLDWLR